MVSKFLDNFLLVYLTESFFLHIEFFRRFISFHSLLSASDRHNLLGTELLFVVDLCVDSSEEKNEIRMVRYSYDSKLWVFYVYCNEKHILQLVWITVITFLSFFSFKFSFFPIAARPRTKMLIKFNTFFFTRLYKTNFVEKQNHCPMLTP